LLKPGHYDILYKDKEQLTYDTKFKSWIDKVSFIIKIDICE